MCTLILLGQWSIPSVQRRKAVPAAHGGMIGGMGGWNGHKGAWPLTGPDSTPGMGGWKIQVWVGGEKFPLKVHWKVRHAILN